MKKLTQVEEIKDYIEGLALKMRQSVTPSHAVMEMQHDIKDLKETLIKVLEQTTKTNGRVTRVETKILVITVAIIVIVILKFPELTKLTQFMV